MDYRIFNVRTWSFLCVHLHSGVGHTDSESAQHVWLGETLTNFSCAPDGVWTSGHRIHWILRLTLYQWSHPITRDPSNCPPSPPQLSFLAAELKAPHTCCLFMPFTDSAGWVVSVACGRKPEHSVGCFGLCQMQLERTFLHRFRYVTAPWCCQDNFPSTSSSSMLLGGHGINCVE